MSMSVTSVRLQRVMGGEEGGPRHRIETSQFTVRASLCARSPLRLRVWGSSPHFVSISPFLFYSEEQSREEYTRRHWPHSLIKEVTVWMNIFSFQSKGIWRVRYFFHGLAAYSHLDVKRCDENEVKVLTCLSFVLFSVIKEQPWLYMMCPRFGVSAI